MAEERIDFDKDESSWDIEFWKSDCEEKFNKWKSKLMSNGYTSQEATEFLTDVYYTVSEEFGN